MWGLSAMSSNIISKISICFAFFVFGQPVFAQPNYVMTESGAQVKDKVRDNFYDRNLHLEKLPLEPEYVNERDVMWEKRIWREINVQTKRNHPFAYANRPFAEILFDLVKSGDATAYATNNDEFTTPLCADDIAALLDTKETIVVIDPETLEEKEVVVENKFDYSRVKRFRLKEVWYFDSKYSKLNVRILGIAPIVTRLDDMGNVLFEGPLCWFYYPELRNLLTREEAFNEGNDAARMTWTDMFDARLFESNITKESNVHDRRIEDYKSGIDALVEADKIKEGIFNFEHDLWEY
jgi:gliding motility associated protien GldN